MIVYEWFAWMTGTVNVFDTDLGLLVLWVGVIINGYKCALGFINVILADSGPSMP